MSNVECFLVLEMKFLGTVYPLNTREGKYKEVKDKLQFYSSQ